VGVESATRATAHQAYGYIQERIIKEGVKKCTGRKVETDKAWGGTGFRTLRRHEACWAHGLGKFEGRQFEYIALDKSEVE